MNRLRWGIIGCGDVARKRVAQAIRDEHRSELLAACRRDAAKLKEFCGAFGIERAYERDLELLADPEIDAVYIATPVHLHLPQTRAAARAGKHVLVEKPMALSTAECDEMIAACRRAGVRLGIAYYRRFYAMVARIKELLRSGEIGRPLAVSAVTATPLAMRPGDEGYWRVIPEQGGGGALMDIGSHRIDLFLDLFGPVRQVRALCATVVADYQAEDSALLAIEFESGLLGNLQCHFGSNVDPDEFAILGTHGRLVARPLNGDRLIVAQGTESRVEIHPVPENLCGPLVADFVSAVVEGREPTVTGETGRLTNRVMEQAYRDAQALSPGSN